MIGVGGCRTVGLTPTTIASSCSVEVISPMTVTGIDSASDGSSPAGIVTLLAASAAWIC